MLFKKKRIALIVAQTLAIQAITINASSAATVTVTNPNDEGVGCTFRDAITAINNQSSFRGCNVTGTFSNNTLNDLNFAPNVTQISLTQGQVEINNSLISINNTGQEVTISGDGTDRLLKIDQSTVEINTVTLTGGVAIGDGFYNSYDNDRSTGDGINDDGGGAIRVDSSTVTLNSSTVSGNTAVGIRNPDPENSYENFPSYGGGIHALSSTLKLNDSSISNNTVLNGNPFYITYGSAIFADSTSLTFNNSSVSNNTGEFASAVEFRSTGNTSTLTINNSTFNGNQGGGVSANNTTPPVLATINNSIFSGNGLEGLSIGEGVINNSIISNNNLDSDFFSGSALNVGGGEVTVNNSTISNNLYNGAIFVNYGTLTLNNTTVTGNKRARDPRPRITLPETGGIDILRNVTLNLNNSIIAGNRGIFDGGNEIGTFVSRAGVNTFQPDTNVTINVNNSLIGDSGAPGQTFFAPPPINGNAIINPAAIDNILAPLADNGGSTQTHALVEGSPAIDAGDCITHPAGTEDQRGEPRIQGNACDLGAFEGSVQATTADETIFTIPLPNNSSVIFGL